MSSKIVKGLAIASAAAGLFAMSAGVTTVAAQDAKVACTGVNACKGTSECKTAKSACKGQNACKGTGVSSMTKADCDKAQAAARSNPLSGTKLPLQATAGAVLHSQPVFNDVFSHNPRQHVA